MRSLRIGGFYRHYKNMPYKVLGVVRHSETLEEMVHYESLYPNDLGRFWVRPKEMFLSKIDDGRDRFADDKGPTSDEQKKLNDWLAADSSRR